VAQLGFGGVDVFALNFSERIYSVAFAMACLIAFALWLANLVASLIRLQVINKEDRDNEEALRSYLQERGVSWALRTRAWKVVHEVSERRQSQRMHEDQVNLLTVMPKTLAFELRAEAFVPTLTSHPFFGVYGISQADRHAISSFLKTKDGLIEASMDPDQEVFQEREIAKFMYFVVVGKAVYRWRREVKEVKDCEWMSEASLWLRWTHVGQAFTKTECELLLLDADIFRRIAQPDLPEASKYAKRFHQLVNGYASTMNDLKPDKDSSNEIATDVFAPPKEFQLMNCVPKEDINEWDPQERVDWSRHWQSPWTDSCLLSSSTLITTLTAELKSDIILIYQTLFPSGLDSARSLLALDYEKEMLDLRVGFLKRFYLLLAVAGLGFTDTENGSSCRPWPFPMAAALCHGGRITFRLEDVSWIELLNILLTGTRDGNLWKPDNPPPPFYVRHAATHGVTMDMDSKHLNEVRRKGAAALSRGHYGVDLPVGGVGNPTPPHRTGELHVGPAGVPFKYQGPNKQAQVLDAYQHGHLYLRYDDFGKNSVRTLIREDSQKQVIHVSTFDPDKEEGEFDDGIADMRRQSTEDMMAREFDPHFQQTQELKRWSHVSETLGNTAIHQTRKALIHSFSTEQRELKFVRHSNDDLECRGSMIRLILTTVGEDGKERILKHCSAHATIDIEEFGGGGTGGGIHQPFSRAADRASEGGNNRQSVMAMGRTNTMSMAQEMHKDEVGCITVVCRRGESWLTALTRHLREMFKLPDMAVKNILDGCREEAHLFSLEMKDRERALGVSSFCYRHVEACGSDIRLSYDILMLQSTISTRDARLFKTIMAPRFTTLEENVDLQGFNGQLRFAKTGEVQPLTGQIKRTWMWADRLQIMPPPPDAHKLKVLVRNVHISSLLIGMESSAPLKEDLFGNEHNMAAQSKTTSAFGKRKWRDYRHLSQPVPAEMGGIRVSITPDVVDALEKVAQKLPISRLTSPSGKDELHQETQFYKELLHRSDRQVDAVLQERLGISRPRGRQDP